MTNLQYETAESFDQALLSAVPVQATAAGYKAQAAGPVDASWLPWTAAAAQTLYVTGEHNLGLL